MKQVISGYSHGLHNLWRSRFGVDEPPFVTYFDVHQTWVWTHSHIERLFPEKYQKFKLPYPFPHLWSPVSVGPPAPGYEAALKVFDTPEQAGFSASSRNLKKHIWGFLKMVFTGMFLGGFSKWLTPFCFFSSWGTKSKPTILGDGTPILRTPPFQEQKEWLQSPRGGISMLVPSSNEGAKGEGKPKQDQAGSI